MYVAGTLEILTYVPAKLLKRDLDEMDMEEFMEALAMARYVQELKSEVVTRGVANAFE